ncbi:hypothetical protein ILUMI_00415 [Ignelater luminosus]|uniref:Zinc finger BED domain-containing protein 5 n=1 Tax=Ignelater luminosus TaxID=2038154 RepID=A0A8K0GN50_IGNLU|nr:hypothetical protein ILUMI_00415 [Ignelater luminosus]
MNAGVSNSGYDAERQDYCIYEKNRTLDEIKESTVLINNHLISQGKQFSFHFQDLDMSKYEWIRNPFVIEKYDDCGLLIAEQEMIIELPCDSTLKEMFQQENNIVTFWLRVKTDFPTLTNKALEVLLPFVTSYLCVTGFSAVAVLKTKYRSRIVIEEFYKKGVGGTKKFETTDVICR